MALRRISAAVRTVIVVVYDNIGSAALPSSRVDDALTPESREIPADGRIDPTFGDGIHLVTVLDFK